MDIIKAIASELNVRNGQVEAAVKLIDEGCTIPFISRYRKEATGALNDEQLRNLDERLKYLRNLEDKKAQVIESIEEQGLLTDELKAQIEKAGTMVAVESLSPEEKDESDYSQGEGARTTCKRNHAPDDEGASY